MDKLISAASLAHSQVEKMRNLINKDNSFLRNYRINEDNFDNSNDFFKKRMEFQREYEECKIKLSEVLTSLLFYIRKLFPREADYIQTYLPALAGSGEINPYDFGAIQVLVSLTIDKVNRFVIEKNNGNLKNTKIFISHSSKDCAIVRSFIDNILVLGCGIDISDIFCSSIESNGIKTGMDLREQLKSQLKDCDMVFFMISDNYMESTICMNEMGASWVLDKDVKPLLFPQHDYSKMGWLYEISKGMKIDNEQALDELRDSVHEKFQITKKSKTSDWTHRKKQFIHTIGE